MIEHSRITTLFLDIGGVLLSNGWGRGSRKLATEKFMLDGPEMENRHNLCFNTHELGKLTLDKYLDLTVFYEPKSFTKEVFLDFMYAQTTCYPHMIDMIAKLKKQYGLKVAIVNNEGRELNDYRIKTYKLDQLADLFISSCFVNLRKPDVDIFSLALDIALVKPEEVIYIDDQEMHICAAETLGINGIVHTGFEETRKTLTFYGFEIA